MTKRCPACKATKTLEEFHKGASYCKSCSCEKAKAQRQKNRNAIKPKIITKTCASCGTKKKTAEFNASGTTADGFFSYCKNCASAYGRVSGKRTRTKTSLKNADANSICREGTKRCYKCGKRKRKMFFSIQRDKADGLSGLCKTCAGEKRKAWRNSIKDTMKYKMINRLRSRFHQMFRAQNLRKRKPMSKYGINISAIIESLGEQPSQTHQIDHVFPITAFDLTNPIHIKACWAPENLQWLERDDNIKKRNRYDKEEFTAYINRYAMG